MRNRVDGINRKPESNLWGGVKNVLRVDCYCGATIRAYILKGEDEHEAVMRLANAYVKHMRDDDCNFVAVV